MFDIIQIEDFEMETIWETDELIPFDLDEQTNSLDDFDQIMLEMNLSEGDFSF